VGELDLCKDCVAYPGGVPGIQEAILTVLVTWFPLTVAGVGLDRWRVVHPAMRGAGLLRLLARLAIMIEVGAVAFPLLLLAGLLNYVWSPALPWLEVFLIVVIGLSVVLPIAAISGIAIVAWHRVLATLTSREGEGRMLV
jgi:hypothetical protein